ncbi:hypothetical protein F7R13_25565 [Burkholderia territorii]|uniref:Uncharacterized protein n=1 Tax=Burkholderia territorii TaxID=1503055 RepID=A0A6L3NA07_9BURK|nr:hypothetical protein F7R13_25565 [Burkholderia territorii]TXG02694.1 hypothetical protein FU139_32080 [Burkholderia territorii]
MPGVQLHARYAKSDHDQCIRMTDCRYVFQRPAEAARLHARRRYAVRRTHARANARPPCLPPPCARVAGRRRGPLRDTRATSFIRMSQREQSHDRVQPFVFARRGIRGPSVPT